MESVESFKTTLFEAPVPYSAGSTLITFDMIRRMKCVGPWWSLFDQERPRRSMGYRVANTDVLKSSKHPCSSMMILVDDFIRGGLCRPPHKFWGKSQLCLGYPCDSVNIVGIQTITDVH